MTNADLLKTAMEQSAVDLNCQADDFLSFENVVVESKAHPSARKYLQFPLICNLVSYGNNIVASVSPQLKEIVKEYIGSDSAEHCFQVPKLYQLNDLLKSYGVEVRFAAEFFLPDLSRLTALPCPYSTKLLMPEEFSDLYLPEWENALSGRRKEQDVLALGAYDEEKLVGLAGCSADCDTMWQIGIDVLPNYRRQGIASALTSRLALEILKRGKVPFYCAAWPNLQSVGNALKSGFVPTWTEVTVKASPFSKIN